MRMELRLSTREPESELRRRARVIAYRLMRGELVLFSEDEEAWDYVADGIRVPPGSAAVPDRL